MIATTRQARMQYNNHQL